MNWIWAKIILSFFGLVFFVVLVFFSFSWSDKNVTILPDFWKSQIGEYKHEQIGTWEDTKSKAVSSELTKWNNEEVLEKNLNIFTSIYSNNSNYTVSKKSKKIELTIWTWAYLIDSKNPFHEIVINVWEYNVSLKNGGMVYIENTWEKGFIVSLNNITNVSFEKGVEMYLYPHMYFWFKVSRFSKRNKIDSLRLSQLANSLWYFSEHFRNVSEGVLWKLVKEKEFFNKAIKITSKNKSNILVFYKQKFHTELILFQV